MSNGGKKMAPENVCVPGPDAPLAHRRPGYSLSGCTPAEPDSASPGKRYFTLKRGESQRTGKSREVRSSGFKKFHVKIESGTEVASRGTDMAQGDAAGVNGGNRILSHGAPLRRLMPNGCLGSPVIVLLLVLTEASSWMSDRSAQRSNTPKLGVEWEPSGEPRNTEQRKRRIGRPTCQLNS